MSTTRSDPQSDGSVGRTIASRYLLTECIGEGGMGRIYRADDQKLLRHVAIKLLQQSYSRRPDSEQRFRREATIGAQLSHPHIVRTYDFGRDGDSLYLVMELLEGNNLSAHIRSSSLTLREVLRISLQISDAMTSAHSQNLVHRDLKPENIFVLSGSPLVCKVVDFGMALAIQGNMDIARLTAEGVIGGTPMYMAPEQLCGQDPQRASDVYSLACIVFLMLTGQPPYTNLALGELAAHHLYAPIPEVPDSFTDVPPVLRELLRRCLAKKPAARPTMKQVRDRLSLIIDNKSDSVPMAVSVPLAEDETLGLPTNRVALRGTFDQRVLLAVAAAGMEVISESDLVAGDALLSLGETTELLSGISTHDVLVVADSELNDMARISSLLRLGVQEVISRPVRPDDAIKKLRRAFRSRRREAKGSSS